MTTATTPPAFVVRPGELYEYDHVLSDSLLTFAEELATRHRGPTPDVRELGSLARGPATIVGTGPYHRDTLVELLVGSEQTDEQEGFTLYESEADPLSLAVGDETFILGRRTQASSSTAVVEAAIAAGTGGTGYVDETGTAPVVNALSESALGYVVPVDGPQSSTSSRGLFPSEIGWGRGIAPGEDQTTLSLVRAFDSDVPGSGLEQYHDETPTVDGNVATYSEGVDSLRVGLRHVAASPRDTVDGEPRVERVDGRVDTVAVSASRYLFDPFFDDDVTVQTDTEVTFELTSADWIHGFAIEDTSVDRTLIPGETASVTVTFEESGFRTIDSTIYSGAGYESMEARLKVVDPDEPSYQFYLEDANGYDGTVPDRRGRDEVTVAVGAGEAFAFDPPGVRVSPGTTVTWEWTGEGGAHNVVSNTDEFTSGSPEGRGTYRYTFEETGIYRYHCVPHRGQGMLGVVDVQPR